MDPRDSWGFVVAPIYMYFVLFKKGMTKSDVVDKALD